jgi:hypothetical protein
MTLKKSYPIKMPKRHRRNKTPIVTEKPVFTFRQMERVVDLIDRQARLFTGEKVLPADDYVYAKNEGEVFEGEVFEDENTIFYYDSNSNTYYFTLKARYPAIYNYLLYKKRDYTDGVVGVYFNAAHRYRIYLENTDMYAKFNPNDANLDESTVTFYNIPPDDIKLMYDNEFIYKLEYDSYDYYTKSPVDYHRDYIAGEGPL